MNKLSVLKEINTQLIKHPKISDIQTLWLLLSYRYPDKGFDKVLGEDTDFLELEDYLIQKGYLVLDENGVTYIPTKKALQIMNEFLAD